jgi:hypothetical protein
VAVGCPCFSLCSMLLDALGNAEYNLRPLSSCPVYALALQMDVAIAAADLTKHAAWRAAWTPKQRVLEVSMCSALYGKCVVPCCNIEMHRLQLPRVDQ